MVAFISHYSALKIEIEPYLTDTAIFFSALHGELRYCKIKWFLWRHRQRHQSQKELFSKIVYVSQIESIWDI